MKLDPTKVDLATLRRIWAGASARLDDASMQRVVEAAASVERIVAGGETVYGVNTGFGLLANTRIPDDRLAELQRNLILSHCCGVGPAGTDVAGVFVSGLPSGTGCGIVTERVPVAGSDSMRRPW